MLHKIKLPLKSTFTLAHIRSVVLGRSLQHMFFATAQQFDGPNTQISPKSSKMEPLQSSKINAKMISSAATPGAAMGPHALHFKIERYFAASMIPLLPASYFIHGSFMDYALALAIVLHSHWGMMVVVQDYARPIVIGEVLAKIAPTLVFLTSVLLLVGLLLFNYKDVGLTKAFEMFFNL